MKHQPYPFLHTAPRIACLLTVLAALLLPARTAAQGAQPSVYADLSTEPATLYAGQPFYLVLTVRSANVRLGDRYSLSGLPSADTLAVGEWEERQPSRDVRGGDVVEVRRHRALCRAPAAGARDLNLTVHAVRVVAQRTFFGRQWVETPLNVPVRPFVLSVQALPPPPPDFSGIVQDVAFDLTVEPTEVAVGDLVRLRAGLRGLAGLEGLRPPLPQTTGLFKRYEPRLLEETPAAVTVEQVVIPLATNAVAIPPVTLTWFSPSTGRYETTTRGPFPLTVLPERAATVETRRYRPEVVDAPTAVQREADTPQQVLQALRARIEARAATLAWASGLLGAMALIAPLLLRRRGRQARLAVAVALFLPAGCALLLRAAALSAAHDAAIVRDETAAHLAPGPGATALFLCRAGERVRIMETHGSWARVATDGREGWIPAASLQQ